MCQRCWHRPLRRYRCSNCRRNVCPGCLATEDTCFDCDLWPDNGWIPRRAMPKNNVKKVEVIESPTRKLCQRCWHRPNRRVRCWGCRRYVGPCCLVDPVTCYDCFLWPDDKSKEKEHKDEVWCICFVEDVLWQDEQSSGPGFIKAQKQNCV